MVPLPSLTIFTAVELEKLVCGQAHIDIDTLRFMAVYEGYAPSDRVIQQFWQCLESFTMEERAKFLFFVSGKVRLPSNISEWDRRFKITQCPAAHRQPDKYLPISHACFNSLELPAYTSYEVMRDRLLYSITQCNTVDADTTENARNAARAV